MKSHYALLLILLVTACQPASTPTSEPTSRYIRVGFLPALGSWRDEIAACAEQISGIAVGTIETTAYSPEENQSRLDIFLQFPQNPPDSRVLFRIGQEKMVLVVNTANSIDHLTVEQWSSILVGEISNWSQMGDGNSDLPITLWLYPFENSLSKALFAEFPSVRTATIAASMAPDPISMLEIVSDETSAIGIVPSSWLETRTTPHNVKAVPLIEADTEVTIAVLDVLAVTEPEPDDAIRTLLKCVQQSSN